jgi:hypothetical protein
VTSALVGRARGRAPVAAALLGPAVTGALLAIALLGPAFARAHQAGVSYGEVAVRGDAVAVTLRAAEAELATLVDPAPRDALHPYAVEADGAPCPLEPGEVIDAEPPDGLRLVGTFRCARPIERVTIRVGLVERLPRGHVHLAEVVVGGQRQEHVARAGSASFEVRAGASAWSVLRRFLALGVGHILSGPDHLAFVVGLLLLGGSWRALAAVISSFTLAHSLTLALSALRVLDAPARVVEPLIAASVVYVAVEGLRARSGGAPPTARRGAVAFAFGLVHGLGFADVLRELGLAPGRLATSLVAFNVGVELGQLAIVAVALPAVAALRRAPAIGVPVLRAGSLVIGGAGLAWLVARVTAG